MPRQKQVVIPLDVVELYQAAKLALIYVEERKHKWDANALPRVRDALDHLVAAARKTGKSEMEELAKAKNHLREAGVVGLETIVVDCLEEIERIERRWVVRSLLLVQPDRELIRDHMRRVNERLDELSGDPVEYMAQLEEIYGQLDELLQSLTVKAPRRWKVLRQVVVLVVIPIACAIAGALLATLLLR
jgi:hypothetical protein